MIVAMVTSQRSYLALFLSLLVWKRKGNITGIGAPSGYGQGIVLKAVASVSGVGVERQAIALASCIGMTSGATMSSSGIDVAPGAVKLASGLGITSRAITLASGVDVAVRLLSAFGCCQNMKTYILYTLTNYYV